MKLKVTFETALLVIVAAGALFLLVQYARKKYAKWLRTSFRPASIYKGFINQDVQPFNKYQVDNRFLPLEKVPADAHLTVKLPPVPVRDRTFKSYNPGCFVVGEDTYTIMRVSNYTLVGDIAGRIRSENFLYNFRTNRYRHIDLPETQTCLAQGYEDARAFVFRGDVYMLTTSFTGECVNTMHLIKLDVRDVTGTGKGALHPMSIVKLTPDPRVSGTNSRREKNWLPFVHKDDLYMVYSFEPHVVLHCNVTSGACTLFSKTVAPRGMFVVPEMRGSTNAQLVTGTQWGDIYVAFTHTTHSMLYTTYVYAFRAHAPFDVVAVGSKPIYWARGNEELPYVEFTCGFAIVPKNGVRYWIVSFGQNDCRPYIAAMTEAHGLSLLLKK